MEGKFQDQGHIDQDSEEWLYPIGNKPDCRLFSEEEKQSIHIEGSAPEGAIIINQDTEGEISTTVVVKWLDKVEGYGDNIDAPLCGGL